MLELPLGFILQLVAAVKRSFYCQIFKLFEVILSLFSFESIDLSLLIVALFLFVDKTFMVYCNN